jgi:hypothetical protein
MDYNEILPLNRQGFIFCFTIFSEGNSVNLSNLSKLGVAKMVISGVVGIGTGKIITTMIKTHVRPHITSPTIIDKVTITAATLVISAIATERTKIYTNDMIDDLAKQAGDVIAQLKLQQKLDRVNSGKSTLEKEGLTSVTLRKNDEGKWEQIKEKKNDETVEANTIPKMSDGNYIR